MKKAVTLVVVGLLAFPLSSFAAYPVFDATNNLLATLQKTMDSACLAVVDEPALSETTFEIKIETEGDPHVAQFQAFFPKRSFGGRTQLVKRKHEQYHL